MNLQDQVTSLEISKRLKELGVKQESLFYWVKSWDVNGYFTGDEPEIEYLDIIEQYEMEKSIICSAYTVAELGEMLPSMYTEIHINENKEQRWDLTYKNKFWLDENEANARAKMLIYLLENKLIEIK